MKPELFGLSVYWAFIIAGVVVGGAVSWRVGRGWGLSRWGFVLVQLCLGLAGFLGAKLQFLLEPDALGTASPIADGFRYVGGIGAALVALLILLRWGVIKMNGLKVLDSCALATCAALAVARIGCFFEGCCFGTVTHGLLGVTFPPASPAWRAQVAAGVLSAAAVYPHPVHPLQLYFLLLWALLFGALLTVWRRGVRDGTVLLVFVFADGLARWVLEPLRFEPVGFNAWSGLVTGLAAAALLVVYRPRLAHRPLPSEDRV
jgi:prolipoprotein diacylglyceryltransferase